MKKATSAVLRFTHVDLENWRNFSKAAADVQRRVFLVGPNASGKSNFLDVFRFLRDVVSVGGGFQEAVRKRGGVSRLRCLFARRYSDLMVRVRVGADDNASTWEYELHFTQDNLRRPLIRKECVRRDGSVLFSRPDDEDKADPERLTQTHLEQVNVNKPFRELADFFGGLKYLHIVPQLIREPDRSVGKRNDPFGGDFLEQIAKTPNKTRNAWLSRIRDALRIAVPQLEDLELWRDPTRGTPHLRSKYKHWRPYGAWQTEDQFSDGTLRLLGLLWATLDGSGPLLLEEPELSLHPEVVRYLPQMFARMQRRSGRQVIISTHSTDILRDEGIGIDEVLLLKPEEEGTAVRLAADIAEIKALREGSISLDEVVIPHTRPEQVQELARFGEK